MQHLDQRSSALGGFKDTSPPLLPATDQLVSRIEQILINRPFQVVTSAVGNRPLKELVRPSGNLPGVSGERELTGGEFGRPGSRRIVFLPDGTTIEEQALECGQKDTDSRFRYLAWNYSMPKGRPVEYAVGEFRTSQVDASHALIIWTYSFKLRNSVLPGRLGRFGRWPFRVSFADRDYATLMHGVLQGYKDNAESLPKNVAAGILKERNSDDSRQYSSRAT